MSTIFVRFSFLEHYERIYLLFALMEEYYPKLMPAEA